MTILAQHPTMTTEITRRQEPDRKAAERAFRQQLEDTAAQYARNEAYERHAMGLADSTRQAHAADMRTFVAYLVECKHTAAKVDVAQMADAMMASPTNWDGIGYGIAVAYRRWLLKAGYSLGTVGRKLSTMRVYAKLALQAVGEDTAFAATLAGVRNVEATHSGRLAENVDDARQQAGTPTRMSTQRTSDEMLALSSEQIKALKAQCDPSTPQGRRDAVLVCLAIDHGLRIGEICGAVVAGVVRIGKELYDVGLDLDKGTLRFFREKVRIVQTHDLSSDTLLALIRYRDAGDMPESGKILRGSRKGGKLTEAGKGISTTAASARIGELAAKAGIYAERDGRQVRISAHDCRHTWATHADRLFPNEVEARRIAGGWKTTAMLRRYVTTPEIANRGINVSLGR